MPALLTTNNYLYTANLEAVRLYDRAGVMAGAVASAKRLSPGTFERAPADGQYIGTVIDFRLPAAQVVATILPGFKIVDDDSVVYVVTDVDPPGTWGGIWRCFCIALLAFTRRITWHLPTDSIGSDGSPITDQSSTLPEEDCAIQEVRSEEVMFQGIVQGFRRHYDIWLLTDPRLPVGTIGVDDRSYTYQVTGQRNRNRLDELCVVEAIINP